MAAARAGHAGAFDELVRRYERPLFAYLRRFLGSAEDAEEAFQETFLRVFRHMDRFRASLPFRPWLYRIATNAARDRLRYRRRRRMVSLDAAVRATDDGASRPLGDCIAASGPDPDAGARLDEAQRRLEGAVAALPEKQRAVFLMARYDEMAYEDIARALRVPVGTVKSRMNRASRFLLEQMKDFTT